ncbi:MAG: hypothetical protein KC472_05480, partial [Dehalococcoidia bacterium]|nr:hypothetical protein [Dehalococcoidia bacterium]
DRRLRGATPDAAFAASHVGSLEVDLAMDARLDSIAARAAEDASVAVDPENDDVYQDGPGRESAG